MRESTITYTCHNFKTPGHNKKYYKELLGKSDKPNNVKSGSHSGGQYYHHRNDSRNSSVDNKRTKDETFVADRNVTGCDKCSKVNPRKMTNRTLHAWHWIQFYDMSPPLILRNSRLSTLSRFTFVKAFRWFIIDSRSRVENAGIHKDRTFHGHNRCRERRATRYRTGYITDRSTRYILCLEDSLIAHTVGATAPKGVKTIIEQKGLSLDLGAFKVQSTRLGSMEYLDLKK